MRIPLSVPLTLNELFENSQSIINLKQNATIYFITTNSKEAQKNDLFIAIKGEKADGEKYVAEAKSRGAYILSRQDRLADLLATDTTLALLEIASYFKTKLKKLKKTVAITGSVGKTTTKNVVSKMLSTKYKTHATKENYNNYLGMSYTVLSAPMNTEILICELGMNHLGEISLMSKMLKPDISVITNIGTSHIGNLGSRELIAKAKLEITDGMKEPYLIVPFNEPLLTQHDAIKYTYSSINPNADFYIQITDKSNLYNEFNVISKFLNLKKLKANLPGEHSANALCISVALMTLIGVNEKDIENAISFVDDECLRGKIIKIDDFYVYDDTYSSSYEAAICDFKFLNLFTNCSKSCMLGDMLELGEHSAPLHKNLGKAVYKYGFRNLYAFGIYAEAIATGALEAGMKKDNIFIKSDTSKMEMTANQILKNKANDEIILFKASHDIHAEKIIDLLINHT